MVAGFVTCGPNEALVISGVFLSKPSIVPGGRAFVWPIIQQLQRISLNVMTLHITSPRVFTAQGVPMSVTGIAQVKVQGQHDELLSIACELFLDKTDKEIEKVALETLEGHQRAIMGAMTVDEIFKDRKKFNQNVFKVASSDLINMGISVLSYTLKDIQDDEGYLEALGMGRTAEVMKDARIGEAEAVKISSVQTAMATEQQMAAKYSNDTQIAQARRDFELKKACYDKEVFAQKAEAELAYVLQSAKTQQKIKEEQMEIKVIERTQQILIQNEEIIRREKELEATVKQPAAAEKFRLETIAEAHRNRVMFEADAESESIRVKGEAEAFAIAHKAKAEAAAMTMKAEAWKEYKEAALLDMFMDTLPKIAAQVAAPLSRANKVTMVSSGDSDIGASKLTSEVMDIVVKVPAMVNALTGIDVSKRFAAM